MAVPDLSFDRRCSKSSSMKNINPEFDALVKPFTDWPGKAIRSFTPGTALAISEARRTTASVRSSEAASGSCTMPIRYCLSWAGMKPLGTALNMKAAPAASTAYTTRVADLRPRMRFTPPS
jgi:hypothetical protein